jgi:putative two-component system response regulator
VPEDVLSEPERDAASRAAYREHPRLTARILAPIESLAPAVGILAAHHERLDGSGYPAGIAGDDFGQPAEILAVANELDHLRRGSSAGGPEPAAALREAAAAGHFRAATVEAVLAASAAVPEEPALDEVLPVPVAEASATILVADAAPATRQLYRALLEGAGYRAVVVRDGVEAAAALAEERPDLLLLDVRIPGVSGDELCRQVKSGPDAAWLPVILITAFEERESRRRALEAGADDLLLSPANRAELLARVRSLLRLRVYHQDFVEHESVVRSLAAALEAKDAYIRGHSARVGDLSARLARELGEPEELAERLRLGGLLHDLGKVAVPQRLLHKPGRLTSEEFEQVMAHPVVGWEICRRLRSAGPVLDVIRYHHERFDGRGYPEGLAGEKIPWQARILSVADALDALTSERPYRRSLSVEEGVALLAQETEEGKWDPRVFRALESLYRRGAADPRRRRAS